MSVDTTNKSTFENGFGTSRSGTSFASICWTGPTCRGSHPDIQILTSYDVHRLCDKIFGVFCVDPRPYTPKGCVDVSEQNLNLTSRIFRENPMSNVNNSFVNYYYRQ